MQPLPERVRTTVQAAGDAQFAELAGGRDPHPAVIAQEIVDLWLHGSNGDVVIKMRPELPAQRIDEPELPPWW